MSEEREAWLMEHDVSEIDVMVDDLGREFIYEREDNGVLVKILLPNFEDNE